LLTSTCVVRLASLTFRHRNGFSSTWDLTVQGKERYFIAEVGGNFHDVGSEDIHIGREGANYGWPHCEGKCNSNKFPECSCSKHDMPIYNYEHHGNGACIIGGTIYRGKAFPKKYQGAYFFGDFVQGTISMLTFDGDGSTKVSSSERFEWTPGDNPTEILSDNLGNIWSVQPLASMRVPGRVIRVCPRPLASVRPPSPAVVCRWPAASADKMRPRMQNPRHAGT